MLGRFDKAIESFIEVVKVDPQTQEVPESKEEELDRKNEKNKRQDLKERASKREVDREVARFNKKHA